MRGNRILPRAYYQLPLRRLPRPSYGPLATNESYWTPICTMHLTNPPALPKQRLGANTHALAHDTRQHLRKFSLADRPRPPHQRAVLPVCAPDSLEWLA